MMINAATPEGYVAISHLVEWIDQLKQTELRGIKQRKIKENKNFLQVANGGMVS